MVLSNKKLKEKVREELAKLLASSEAISPQQQTITNNSTTQTRPQSFNSLLDSATQKLRLSKPDKKRKKTESFHEQGSDVVGKEIGENGGSKGVVEGPMREKKRKRKSKDDGGLEKEGNTKEEPKQSNNKMKKKKMDTKKKGERCENVEEEKSVGILESGVHEQIVADTVKVNVSNEKEDISRKVYVGGIPYYSTEDDIRSFFEGCGTITEIDCLYFPETGKFKGIAMISFKTDAAAKRALALDGSDMGGLFLKVQPYKTSKDTKLSDFAPAIMEGYNRIYIGNLSWNITEDELKKLFSGCTISSIRLGKDKETGEFRGFAHVEFVDSLSLTIALKLDQQIVCGRPVRIRCAVPPSSAKTSSKPMFAGKRADNFKLVPSSKKDDDFTPVPSSKKADYKKFMSPSNVDTEDNVGNDVSGKIKWRTCYECGQKGHLSSACPTSKKPEISTPVLSINKSEDSVHEPNYNKADDKNVEENLVDNTLSGKIRRRTCYECGEKGHLSSACPKKITSDATITNELVPGPSSKNAVDTKSLGSTTLDTENNVVTAISGKVRRRTCYECGEKGHLSSVCPKKLAAS